MGRRQFVLPTRFSTVRALILAIRPHRRDSRSVKGSIRPTLPHRSERLQVLDAIQAADLKVLRLFISETFENFKNTGSVYMPDIEPKEVGQFDDTQLAAIDQLMVEAHERGKFDEITIHALSLT